MASSQPLVSVLMPVYNQESLLLSTLESIATQSYKNIEVIIADDKSSDATVEVVKKFLSLYDGPIKFKFIQNPKNLGISKNINSLIRAAKGNFFAFFSGDDLMEPLKIEKQVEHLLSDPECVISYHDVKVIDAKNNSLLYLYSARHFPREGGHETLVKYSSFNCGCSNMVRMDKKIFCDEKVVYASDWLQFIDVLSITNGKIKYLNQILGSYRRHENNITKTNLLSGYDEEIKTLDIVIEKYPDLKKIAFSARAERLMTYGVRIFLEGNLIVGVRKFSEGFISNPVSVARFLKNAYKYIKKSL